MCPEHALQLNYRKNKEALKVQRKAQKRAERKQQRRQQASGEDEEPLSDLGARKRRKHGRASDSEEPTVAGDVPGEPIKHRHHSTAEKCAMTDADAYGKGLHSTSEQQGRSRSQEHTHRQKDEKGGGKPGLEEEADEFLREMFP